MVVPSPPGVSNNILTITVDSPCGSWWGLKVDCPRLLTGIQGSIRLAKGTDPTTVCAAPNQATYYHVPVDAYGSSNPNSSYYASANFPQTTIIGQQNGVLGLHDWIYTDENGENPLAAGLYKMTFDANDGGGLRDWIVEVGVREYKGYRSLFGLMEVRQQGLLFNNKHYLLKIMLIKDIMYNQAERI